MIDTAINKHNLVEVFSCFPNKSLTDGVTSEAGPIKDMVQIGVEMIDIRSLSENIHIGMKSEIWILWPRRKTALGSRAFES